MPCQLSAALLSNWLLLTAPSSLGWLKALPVLGSAPSCQQQLPRLSQQLHVHTLLPSLQETASFDTVGNAYMSLCIHALPAAWRRLAVVTSDFHMPRSRALFADIFRLAGQSIHGDPAW